MVNLARRRWGWKAQERVNRRPEMVQYHLAST
jgi:hypothetical protein